MTLADHSAFFCGLGWLAMLMFAAVWPSLPGGVGWRHAGWLMGFGAIRLLIATQSLVFVIDPEWRQLAAVLSGLGLWEFARRVWNDSGRRRISAATHLGAAECIVIVAAIAAGSGAARPGWFLPIDVLYRILPALLGGGAAWLLWRRLDDDPKPRRAALRLAFVGLGLYGLPGEIGSMLPPWIAAIGLGLACFTLPAARTVAALACAAGLAAIAILGPLAVSAGQRQPDGAEHAELLERIERAAAPWQGKFAAQLAADRLDPETRVALRHHLEKLRTADPIIHAAALERLRGGRVWAADPATGEFVEVRATGADEQSAADRARAFVISADPPAGRPFAIAYAPLIPGRFETPTGWLVLEFPEVFWEVQREQARHMGIAFVGVLGAFCAMGFVLVVRQRLESAQQLDLARARAADRAKTEFLAFLGHELRTPLQAVLGRAELLRGLPAAERHAIAIEAQGRLLLRLVTDLLDLGTIEAGHFRLQPGPFSLRRALAATEDTVHAPAAAKHLGLSISVGPTVPDALMGDEARLRQILGNLLGNAVKYTSRGEVHLEVGLESGDTRDVWLVFRVRDTGPGLPAEKIPQLFTLFTRLDSGGTFTREGTGVGLALVRRLCTVMSGTVAAANRPGGGAEFVVRLPFSPADPGLLAEPAGSVTIAPSGLSVLLAEDNTATRELLVEALSALGHEIMAVADGPAALAMAATRTFDVAVLDINLPGIDGVAVARQLRARQATMRIIGCSAEALPAVRAAALAAGFDEFLVKPVSLDLLARAVGRVPGASSRTLFDQINSPEAAARTRALLLREWPRLRGETETALTAGDEAALRRLSHYLQSSALLLADSRLLVLCERLSAASAETNADNVGALLNEIAEYFEAGRFQQV